jgi:hypothetical protein
MGVEDDLSREQNSEHGDRNRQHPEPGTLRDVVTHHFRNYSTPIHCLTLGLICREPGSSGADFSALHQDMTWNHFRDMASSAMVRND